MSRGKESVEHSEFMVNPFKEEPNEDMLKGRDQEEPDSHSWIDPSFLPSQIPSTKENGLNLQQHKTTGEWNMDQEHTGSGNEEGNANENDASEESEGWLKDSHTPITLQWSELSYEIHNQRRKKELKTILHKVEGIAYPGEVLAILGPSGSGKTTLLNSLSGRLTSGRLHGHIWANGKQLTKRYYTNIAYVEQDDLMFATLTVRETLQVAARLRMPGKHSDSEKMSRVESIIQELGLSHCANTFIGGSEIRGISGGERKRTAIAVELLTNPSILFLDEPTSGLDSFTAYNIVESLQQLSRHNRTVIMTIHQPKANLFELCDKAIFLSQGHIMYYGARAGLIDYFSKVGYPCPAYTNPADYYMDVITVDSRSPQQEEDSQRRVEFIALAFASWIAEIQGIKLPELDSQPSEQQLWNQIQQEPSQPLQPQDFSNLEQAKQAHMDSGIFAKDDQPAPYSGEDTLTKRSYQATPLTEFSVLLDRSWKNVFRDKRSSVFTTIQSILMAVIVGGIFFGAKHDQQGIQNRLGALFFVILNQSFSTLFPTLNIFPAEYAVFRRERSARSYRVLSYYLSKNISELPLQLILPLIFGTITYWMIGFKGTAGAYFTYLAILLAVAIAGQSLGLAISAGVPSIAIANVIAPFILIIFTLFGGFYSNSQSLWGGLAWIQWISYINYAFKALLNNEFSGQTFSCPTGQSCSFVTGEQVIAFYNAGSPGIWVNFVIVLAMALLFKILGFAFLVLRRPRRSRKLRV